MKQPIYYMQTDPKWASHNYSAKGEHKTIGSSGCGITCSAMVIDTLRNKKYTPVTPITTADWSMAHGYKICGQGTAYSYFVPQFKVYNIKSQQLNTYTLYHKPNSAIHTQVVDELKKGNLVIACMGPGNWTKGGHYILAYNIKGSQVYINDPNSKKESRLVANIATWQNEVKYYWVIQVPNNTFKDHIHNTLNIFKNFLTN